jgi:hypothetical protein
LVHEPQWSRLVCRSTHAPLHIVSEPLHVHTPATQVSFAPHRLKHEPHVSGLVIRSTHTPTQFARGAAQPVVHVPALHNCVKLHELVHVPQCARS